MAKKSKLLAALDAHKGRDYKVEKQKKQQKQAEKKKRLKETQALEEEKENNVVSTSDAGSAVQVESDRWESDESEAAGPTPVLFPHRGPLNGISNQAAD